MYRKAAGKQVDSNALARMMNSNTMQFEFAYIKRDQTPLNGNVNWLCTVLNIPFHIVHTYTPSKRVNWRVDK